LSPIGNNVAAELHQARPQVEATQKTRQAMPSTYGQSQRFDGQLDERVLAAKLSKPITLLRDMAVQINLQTPEAQGLIAGTQR